MIIGYAQNGFPEKDFESFKLMQSAGVSSNSTTVASILSVYNKMGDFDQGMGIYQSIKDRGIVSDVVVIFALVNNTHVMFLTTNCGGIDKTQSIWSVVECGRIKHDMFIVWHNTSRDPEHR